MRVRHRKHSNLMSSETAVFPWIRYCVFINQQLCNMNSTCQQFRWFVDSDYMCFLYVPVRVFSKGQQLSPVFFVAITPHPDISKLFVDAV